MSNVPSYAAFGNQSPTTPAYASFEDKKEANPTSTQEGATPSYMSGFGSSPEPVATTTPSYASFQSPATGSTTPAYAQTPTVSAQTPATPAFTPAFTPASPSAYTTSLPPTRNTPPLNAYSSAMSPVQQQQPMANAYASTPVLPSQIQEQDEFDMANYKWIFIVEKGYGLAAKDANGKSDPFCAVELVRAKNVEGTYTNIRVSSKTKTPTINATLNPEWNFQAYTLNADITWSKYNGVKLTCYDKDLVGSPDFMGEAYLWFDEQLPGATTLETTLDVPMCSRPKKKDKVSGYITVKSNFQCTKPKATQTRRPQLTATKPQSATDLAAQAIKRSELVQVSSTGRREVKIPTSGVEKFISFGELPKFDASQKDSTITKAERKYGFNTNIALWLVTCCQLAYKNEEIVSAVCCHVWDMCGFKFIDNQETDTQGFCMYNEEVLVVCFRGTESIRDWMTNLNFLQIEASQFPQRYLKAGVRVHNGFNDALKSVWPQIEQFADKAYKSYPNLKLYICGHSLGGALANLCMGYFTLSDRPRDVVSVYTIGQPRVGNKKYREQLELSSPNTTYIRITNNQDCVPSLAGGQHCGVHIHFDANGRISFDPPMWKKAIQTAKSIQGSAASMSYAGIADHSAPVYRKLIESHWVKSEFSQLANNDGSFNLCERILYLMDMLQEDIKAVQRYKIQFRSLVAQILNVRPIIMFVQDFLACGIDDSSRKKIKNYLLTFFELLSKTKKEVVARHSKKTLFQNSGSKSLKSFNTKMTQLAKSFAENVLTLHTVMKCAVCTPPTELPSYATFICAPIIPKYDDSAYNTIKFEEIDFHALGKTKEKGNRHVNQILEAAEAKLEEGKSAEALEDLVSLESNSIGTLSAEDKALASFLKAKAHAKLHHHQEAIQSLNEASGAGVVNSAMIQDSAFMTLKGNADFAKMQSSWQTMAPGSMPNSPPQTAKLNNFERQMVSELFDEADEDGDNFLTTQEFNNLITQMGGLETILENLGWIDKPDNTPKAKHDHEAVMAQKFEILGQIVGQMQGVYRNAVVLDQFIDLMSLLM